MSDALDDDDMERERAEPLSRALGERYLTYALSTIMHRALPDARDGLKPVHRRILYAMRGLGLGPDSKFLKCAKISGETMGDYHPHGDQAIYDALVRLAQPFAMRYPLVGGQGNFGNIDGDGAAAARYTEARLTAVAQALLDGLDENAVDFRPNYDGRTEEPEVLPAAFPNLLANGSSGIAVGMATSIPPHNAGELCDALLAMIESPEAPLDALIARLPAPDFPTGGVLVEPAASIREAYATGRGGFRLRAAWEAESLPRGQWQIVVTEIPYGVPKGKLIERIAEMITARKLPALADIRDESAEDIRLVLEPRSRAIEPEMLMETLFRQTDLEIRVPLNMNVLIDGRSPKVCGLGEVMRAFLDHRREVLVRRARHRLEKIGHRLEVLEGYVIAFLNLDRVIQIIREEDEPKRVMMAEFGLSDVQAEAILNLRLRALRRLEEMKLREERDALMAERAELEALVASEARQWARVSEEIGEIKRKFGQAAPGGARRTLIAAAPKIGEVPAAALVEREPVTIVCSEQGWIRAMKGHIPLDSALKFRDGDAGRFLFHAETTDSLLAMTSDGRVFTLAADRLPGGRGQGEPIRLMADMDKEARLIALFPHRPGLKRLVASTAGDGFVMPEDQMLAHTRAGRQVLNLKDGAEAALCRPAAGDHVAVVGENRKLLVFALDELPEMSRGKGVRLQKYRDGGLSDAIVFTRADGLTWAFGEGKRRTVAGEELDEYVAKRASAGRMAPRGFPRDNRFT